jgi:hypothetical protein
MAAGLNDARAQALFAYVGGPDSVDAAVIRAALEGEEDVVDGAARTLGDSLERFFDVAIGPFKTDRDDLRLRVATGQLLPAQIAYLRSLDLSKFLLKEGKGGQTSPPGMDRPACPLERTSRRRRRYWPEWRRAARYPGRQATDPDVRKLLGYALRVFLRRVRRSGSPGEQVRAAGSIPESILQSLSAYLDLDPLSAPSELPDLDYQRFFGNLGEYRRPDPGSRLDLTHLLVIVPALLEKRCAEFHDEICLCDAGFVKPLHQRLVMQMRNATAHTYAEMDEKAATFFFKICDTLLEDATVVWGRNATGAPHEEPDRQALADLLSGCVMAA